MLVPRTVYVPFIAQTPVAPVRLSSLTAGGATIVNERRETLSEAAGQREAAAGPQATPPGPREAALAEIADCCLKLNKRLDDIEKRLQLPDAGPVVSQPGCALPPICEPPGGRMLPGCKDHP
jgi:hypothetical protein